MNKQQLKAQKIVAGAVGTFTKAIEEVQKANGLLSSAIDVDAKEMEKISLEIKGLYERLDAVQSNKLNKEAEIIQNKELIAKLEKFVK